MVAALTVAEKGSLRAAARELGMSQPALTQSIGELERELGAALFERRARGMSPTPVGERFLLRARVISTETRRAREEVAQLIGSDQGEVTVCLSSAAHITLLPMALPLFQKRYPEVRLRLIEGPFRTVEARLRDGSVDFYIGPRPGTSPAREFTVETLFENTRTVFARKGHPLGKARSLAELTQATWITTGITDKADSELAQLFAQRQLPPPRSVIQTESMLSLLMTLASSDALAITLRQFSEFAAIHDTLQVVPIEEVLPAPTIVLINRAALPLTPAAEYFCDMFRRASADYRSSRPR